VHSNEFEITLSRELSKCKNTIQRIRKSLGILERKHDKTTEVFIEELLNNNLTDTAEYKLDYDAWQSIYESLNKWRELERHYEEELNKINKERQLPS
jgi:hypothetical protein